MHVENGWKIEVSDCGQYCYVSREGKPGEVAVKADDEGFAVDIWDEMQVSCLGSTAALYADLAADSLTDGESPV